MNYAYYLEICEWQICEKTKAKKCCKGKSTHVLIFYAELGSFFTFKKDVQSMVEMSHTIAFSSHAIYSMKH